MSGLCWIRGATADGPWAAQGALGTLVPVPTAAVGCSSPTALDYNSYVHMHLFVWFLEHLCRASLVYVLLALIFLVFGAVCCYQ